MCVCVSSRLSLTHPLPPHAQSVGLPQWLCGEDAGPGVPGDQHRALPGQGAAHCGPRQDSHHRGCYQVRLGGRWGGGYS